MDSSKVIEKVQNLSQAGDLIGAAKITREALKDDPDNWEYLHILGLTLNEAGLAEQALPFLKRCLALRGADSSLLYNYGVVLRNLNRFGEAARAFRHAAEASPERFDCWFNLGESLRRLGRPDEAVEALSKATDIEPANPDVWCLLGNLHMANDQFEAAIENYKVAVGHAPGHFDALNNLGLALKGAERLPEAAATFEMAIGVDPEAPPPHNNLGNVRVLMGDVTGAAGSFRQALRLKPDYADARFNLADLLLSQRNFTAAGTEFRLVLKTEPQHRFALINLALCLQFQNDPEGAKGQLETALGIWPDDAVLLAQMGNVLRDIGEFEEACRYFERALKLSPESSSILGNLALTCQYEGNISEAVAYCRRALENDSGNEQLHSNLAQALLLTEKYEEGWAEFEHRLSNLPIAKILKDMPGAPWLGEPLAGRSILLRAEQGLGDTIQFARYVADLARMGASITLAGPARLTRLLSGIEGLSEYVDANEPLPAADFHAPLMSLPHRMNSYAIPGADSYLEADPDLVEQWRDILDNLEGNKVGIAWQGNVDYELDYARSVPGELLAQLIASHGVRPVILQQGYGREQIEKFPYKSSIIDFGEELDQSAAFADTAAIMANLDIIVTSDTSIAHLAGALGRPVWVLLPFAPDWRWLLERNDSPWYPSMRLFRQAKPRDWQSVLLKVGSSLKFWLEKGGNPNDAVH